MKVQSLLTASAVIATTVSANSGGLKVTVYEGPKECPDDETIKSGDHLKMEYTGFIDESSETGTKGFEFDSSKNHGEPFAFQIGQGMVIKGWDEGLLGICKGAKATIVTPPEYAYGDDGAGEIPGGATLKFDVEVVDVSDEGPPPPNLFVLIDEDGDGKLTKDEILEHFRKQGLDEIPAGLWEGEDKDGDGFVTWDEFGGPKGTVDPTTSEL